MDDLHYKSTRKSTFTENNYLKDVSDSLYCTCELLCTCVIHVRHCGLVGSAPAWDGTGCEFNSWQCRIYIPCSLRLRLGTWVPSGSLGTYGLTQKLCEKLRISAYTNRIIFVAPRIDQKVY